MRKINHSSNNKKTSSNIIQATQSSWSVYKGNTEFSIQGLIKLFLTEQGGNGKINSFTCQFLENSNMCSYSPT